MVLDAGTMRQSLLDDPLYLGVRHSRVKGEKYLAFVDRFVTAAERLFPGSGPVRQMDTGLLRAGKGSHPNCFHISYKKSLTILPAYYTM